MKSRVKNLFIAFIPSFIISAFFEYLHTMSIINKVLFFVILLAIIWIFIELLIYTWEGSIKSKFDLWRYGKIKGLWIEKGLIRQIEKGFRSSDEIKIKVTRGYDLFRTDEKYGFVNVLDELKKKDSHVNIKFLLIMPCFKEKHVQQRYERHNGLSKEDFLETWYKSLTKMKEYSNENLSLNVRFYMARHARWRFYIFSKKNGTSVNVFLSDYDKNTAGSEHPMYKIIRKDHNIASFMTSYFDEIWDDSLTPLELLRIIEQEQCIRYFCGNCKRDGKCLECPHADCKYIEQCKLLVNKYANELKGFNAE